MSILTDLSAALEAKREAEATLCNTTLKAQASTRFMQHLELDVLAKSRSYAALLTDDTIRALLDVAEAANELCYGGTFPKLQAALAPLVEEADDE